MKLNIVPAKTGVLWVRQGIQTFWRQPIALSGLFFIFMAVMISRHAHVAAAPGADL